RQYHGDGARSGQDSGFRDCQSQGCGRCRIQPHPDPHALRPDRGHGGLHVAGTGRGPGCRLAKRHFLFRLRALRNDYGAPCLSRGNRAGHAGRRAGQGAGARAPIRPRVSPGPGTHRRSLPVQEARRALAIHGRCQTAAGCRAGRSRCCRSPGARATRVAGCGAGGGCRAGGRRRHLGGVAPRRYRRPRPRAAAGNLDIWVQQIGGRDPIRLTTDEADDSEPAISADGARVAFRSERSGGGIYVAPSLGGDAALLAPRGRGPRFSPDGRWIAYWEGRESADLLPGTARVFVIESGGGQARQIGADLAAALYPVWSPAGDEVLVLGRAAGSGAGGGTDWWTVPLQPGPARKTGAFAALAAQRLLYTAWLTDILPLEWRASGRVVFAAGPGDAGNLWEIPVAAGRVQDHATRLTQAPGYQLHASTAAGSARGRMAYSSLEWTPVLWSQALDADRGIAKGELERVAIDELSSLAPSLSADGRYLVYLSIQLGSRAVRARDLTSDKTITLV